MEDILNLKICGRYSIFRRSVAIFFKMKTCGRSFFSRAGEGILFTEDLWMVFNF